MVTPEELAEAACNDQAWKQIQSRAATECHATCFRAAIKILNSQISRLPRTVCNRLETKLRSVWGGIGLTGSHLYYHATTLTTFIGYDELGEARQRMRD